MSKAKVLRICETRGDQSVVDLLEDLLEHAKRGEIVSIAGVTCNTGREFSEFFSTSAFDVTVRMLAYLRVLQLRFEREIET